MESEGVLSWMRIRTDRNYNTYSRTCPNLLDFVENIGGLLGAIFPLGYLLTSAVAQKIFMAQMLKDVY